MYHLFYGIIVFVLELQNVLSSPLNFVIFVPKMILVKFSLEVLSRIWLCSVFDNFLGFLRYYECENYDVLIPYLAMNCFENKMLRGEILDDGYNHNRVSLVVFVILNYSINMLFYCQSFDLSNKN